MAKRTTRTALAALMIGAFAGGLSVLPLGNLALAKNSGDHGHSADHGGGDHGGGDHGGGNGGGNGGAAGGNANGHAKDGGGTDDGSTADTSDDAAGEDTVGGDDSSLSPSGLGKLNGFFHASSQGLANASEDSSIGRISKTFRDALSDYASANPSQTDPDSTTPPSGPTTDDLGAILGGATNKTVTAAQVKAIAEKLAAENPDDASLNDFAANADAATCQDIADAANASKSGATESTGDTTDAGGTDSDTDTSSDGSTDTTTIVTTN